MKNVKQQVVHFIGIGGISMSALAIYIHKKGYKVQGSDKCYTKKLAELESLGIKIFVGHNQSYVKNATVCIYTNAVDSNNPELLYAKNHCILFERSEFLGRICKNFANTIAISGTHGKTTTTAMIGQTFCEANLNPTIHLGGNFKYINGNFRFGSNEIIITEACEYKQSFLTISPDYLIINNVELDHLDFYKNLEEIENTFLKLINQTDKLLILNGDCDFYQKYKNILSPCITFGKEKHCDYQIENLQPNNGIYSFCVKYKNKFLTNISLKITGEYNAMNALACIATCHQFSIPIYTIKQSLEQFNGVERRLEVVAQSKDFTIIKDYAHHPTEIKNVIHNIKCQNYSNIVVIFQPHTYSRTLGLFNEFLQAFNECDSLILVPTYPAREQPIIGATSKDLYFELKNIKSNCFYAETFNDAEQIAKSCISPNTCILLLGAGDIENVFNNSQSLQNLK